MEILILIFLSLSKVLTQIIKVPFKTIYSEKLTNINYITELINNKIYIEIKIGTPYQKIPVLLKLNQIPFFITSSSYNKDIIKFNSTKSITYTQETDKEYKSDYYDYYNAFLGEDIISIQNISNKESFLNRTNFFLTSNLTEKNVNVSGEIGLNIIHTMFISFVNQLKRNKKIDNYIFSLKYITENEGEFHLGNYYHFYDNNFKESEFKSIEVGIPQKARIDSWEINFRKIILSTGNITYGNNVLLSYEFGFIFGTENYHNLIKEIFFDKFEKNCQKKVFEDNNFYYVCDNNINIEDFPDLIFVKDDCNFTLTKDELWKKFEEKYYFLVIFSEIQRNDWIFGKIFFKKYIIFFNLDERIIGFYPNQNQQNSQNTEINDVNKFQISLSWILVILLFILLIIAIIYILYYLNVKKRKTRINELEDKYDYASKEDKNEPFSINK